VRPDADIVVVGAGIVGVATARALGARAGSVVLLEQFELGHDRGSSHGTSRIFRLNYPDERFVRLAQAADAAWRELEQEFGTTLIERVGSLDIGPVAGETARALAACGVPYETLSAAEVTSRFPLLLEPGETAVYQGDGGYARADLAYAALLESVREAGVDVRERTPVRALARERRGIRLSLEDEELTARAVVVAAGAWASGLLAPLEVDLPVVPTTETVVYVDLPGSDRVPSVIDYARLPEQGAGGITRVGQAAYALAAPGRGLKAGLHHSGEVTDLDAAGTPHEGITAWTGEWARSRYPGAGELLAAETCIYTNTADEQFVLERHGRLVVGSACSGHGFKFAPAVGHTLAALAYDAAT
jgi:sarcosine oxidase